jgi:hypothetical protein
MAIKTVLYIHDRLLTLVTQSPTQLRDINLNIKISRKNKRRIEIFIESQT